MRPLREEEIWARACIHAALPGCAIGQHDNGIENSMYDLTITYPDGRVGAVEVAAAVDGQRLKLWKLVDGRDKRWIEPGLAGGWVVRIWPSTRAKDLRRHLPALLRDLERGGLSELRGNKNSAGPSSCRRPPLSCLT